MKSTVLTTCGVLALFLAGQPVGVLSVAGEEEAAADGASTNGLIFKKRTRRQYTAAVTINKPEGAVSAPVEDEEDRDGSMGVDLTRDVLAIGKHPGQGSMQIQPGGPRRPLRAGKERKKDEDDWLLTPQQRIQKEIDLLSGKEEEDEPGESYGWLADEVESIRDEKIKEQERRRREEEEEAEAEEIAAIMGRDLFGSAVEKKTTGLMRDDRGRLQMPAGSEQRRGFGADATNSMAAPTLRIRNNEAAGADMAHRSAESGRGPDAGAAREDTRGAQASAAGGELGKLNRAADDHGSGNAPRGTDARSPSVAAGGAANEAQPVSTGVPSPFPWNPRSGGGYAGLSASVAPSILPAAGAPSAAGGASGSWTFNSGLNANPAGSQDGAGRLSGTRYTYESQRTAPAPGFRTQADRSAGGASTIRTPFMSPMTPGLQGGSGYGTFPARRP